MSPRAQINLIKILEVAIDICNEEGYEQLTLSDVSKRLGIKTPSLYNHIQGLSDLKQKMANYGMQLLYDSVIHAAVGCTGDDAIISVSKAYIEFVHKHPGLYRSISKAPDPYEPQFDSLSNQLVQIFIKLLGAYDLSKEESIHAVRGLRSMLHGFSSIEMDLGFRINYSQEDSLNFALTVFLNGLRNLKSIDDMGHK
ncbi:TetR/AcrR family transcriptional regulator [Clostridium sp. 19966]|uniref:TetR/AcrR family transcriptional regulator n=1 Tax=Clostridium sp. 19966 TaxID=2768166 RepID=UPI0028DF935B|nr:TetR/AcrR family transcriptional regulator [Clostridium sp. 19966]MDT8719221.1 TetR/AcrR family transcriptional regulator [Clostridium sp. 19966]